MIKTKFKVGDKIIITSNPSPTKYVVTQICPNNIYEVRVFRGRLHTVVHETEMEKC